MTSDANITLSVPDTVHMAALVGPGDKLLRLIEESFRSNILVRGNRISITGDAAEVHSLTMLFTDLIKMVEGGQCPDLEYVRHAIDLLHTG